MKCDRYYKVRQNSAGGSYVSPSGAPFFVAYYFQAPAILDYSLATVIFVPLNY